MTVDSLPDFLVCLLAIHRFISHIETSITYVESFRAENITYVESFRLTRFNKLLHHQQQEKQQYQQL